MFGSYEKAINILKRYRKHRSDVYREKGYLDTDGFRDGDQTIEYCLRIIEQELALDIQAFEASEAPHDSELN